MWKGPRKYACAVPCYYMCLSVDYLLLAHNALCVHTKLEPTKSGFSQHTVQSHIGAHYTVDRVSLHSCSV